MRTYDFIRLALIGGVVLLSLLMLIRVLPVVRFFLIMLLLVLLVVVLVYVFSKSWRERIARKDFERTTAGQIGKRIAYCEEQITALKRERKKIEESISELKRKIPPGVQIPENVRTKTEGLIRGFEQERQLRDTKITFYQQCVRKLHALLKQHELLDALEQKRAELEAYREKHYDELAEMESLRWELDREATHLETIQDLSSRMEQSAELDDVLHLQRELDKMLAS